MSENSQNVLPEQPPKPAGNEIDLKELFRMIGSAFNRFFLFIRNILLFLLDLLIRALIIVRVHIVKFAIVGFLSIVIGWFVDSRKEAVFGSSMYVKTNYGSTRQLYSNIKYYQGLVEEGDSMKLADIFSITKDEAGSLRGFVIDPDVTDNGMLKAYNEFMKTADTTFVMNEIDFEKYKKNTSPMDFSVHQVSVYSTEKEIIPALQEPIAKKNVENFHIKRQKEINLENLEKSVKALEKQLIRIDTLSEVYKDLLLQEPKENSSKASNTYIQLASNNEKKTKELELLAVNEKISNRILEINRQREMERETINVLSDFSPGARIRSFYDRYLYRIPMITVSLLLMFILLRELNQYLNTYAENKRMNV
ncbi:hypothetical protein KORDIASMS9_01174 [Kordia sp. SMS9]|uniref:hypothetical protein n=1 Tax=Kordia sp. SMS9 TaxID=2282170 RepID=UPI000E0D1FCB|nr:hypothetical protein [Kordia sp. SMS9]AXG68955.1 hypothetical protein KORDIASMS9_01174 [Kordia sp. SMS9]